MVFKFSNRLEKSNWFIARTIKVLWVKTREAGRDILPLFLVIAFFQIVVIQQPFPNLGEVILGAIMVVVGLFFFLEGLDMGLFPIGESIAEAFAKKGNIAWLLVFSFLLGFSTTVAEPALIAISAEAANVAADAGFIDRNDSSYLNYALGLRLTVAFSVGLAVVLGVLRILLDWPLHYLMAGGYTGVMIMTFFAPREIIGIAYDSGGVTTSAVTVPLVTALGVGLAMSIRQRNPLLHGFGLIAFASLLPIFFVLAYGMIVFNQ